MRARERTRLYATTCAYRANHEAAGMKALDLITELKTERNDLLTQLAVAEQRAHQAARIMYRKGYLAGHSAARHNARTVRGPYSKTRELTG